MDSHKLGMNEQTWKHGIRIGVYGWAFFGVGWALALPGAALTFLASNVRQKEAALGVLFTARGAAYATSSLVGGVLGETVSAVESGAHYLMSIAMGVAAVGMWCAARATSVGWLGLALTGTSVAMGFLDTVGNVATLRSCERIRVGASASMSVVHACFGMGCVAAPAVTRHAFKHDPSAELSAFNASALVCAGCAVALCLVPGVSLKSAKQAPASADARKGCASSASWTATGVAACVLIFTYVGVEQGTGALLSTWAYRSIGRGRRRALDLAAMLWVAMVSGRLAAGLTVPDDLRADVLVIVATMVATSCGFALATANSTALGNSALAVVVFLLGAAYGPIYPVAFARLEARLGGGLSSTFGGVVVAMGGLGEMALPLLIFRAWHAYGAIAYGLSIAFLSLLCVVCWCLVLVTTSRSQLEVLRSQAGATPAGLGSLRRRRHQSQHASGGRPSYVPLRDHQQQQHPSMLLDLEIEESGDEEGAGHDRGTEQWVIERRYSALFDFHKKAESRGAEDHGHPFPGKQLIGKELSPDQEAGRLRALEVYLQATCDAARGLEALTLLEEFFETDRGESPPDSSEACGKLASLSAAVKARDVEIGRLSKANESARAEVAALKRRLEEAGPRLARASWTAVARLVGRREHARLAKAWRLWVGSGLASLERQAAAAAAAAAARDDLARVERASVEAAWRERLEAREADLTSKLEEEAAVRAATKDEASRFARELDAARNAADRERAAAAANDARFAFLESERETEVLRLEAAIADRDAELERDSGALRTKIADREAELEAAREDAAARDAEIRTVAAELEEARAMVSRLEAAAADRGADLEKTRADLESVEATKTRELEEVRADLARVDRIKTRELEKARADLKRSEAAVAARDAELEALREATSVEREATDHAATTKAAEMASIRCELEAVRARLDDAVAESARAAAEREASDHAATTKAAEAAAARGELEALRAQFDDAVAERARVAAEREAAANAAATKAAEAAAARGELEALRAQFDDAVAERARVAAEREATGHAAATKSAEAAAVRGELEALRARFDDVVTERARLAAERDAADHAAATKAAEAAAARGELEVLRSRFDDAAADHARSAAELRAEADARCDAADRERGAAAAVEHLAEIERLRKALADARHREHVHETQTFAYDETLRADLAAAREALERADAEVAALRVTDAKRRGELETLRAARADDQRAHATSQADLRAELEAQHAETKRQAEVDSASLRSQLDDLARAAERLDDDGVQLAATTAALDAAKRELAALRLDHASALRVEASRSVANLEASSDLEREAEARRSMELRELRARLAAAVAERDVEAARAARLDSELKAREAAGEAFEDARESLIEGLRQDLAEQAEQRERVERELEESRDRDRDREAAEQASVRAEIAALRADLAMRRKHTPPVTPPQVSDDDLQDSGKVDLHLARERMSREITQLIECHEREKEDLEVRERDILRYTSELRTALENAPDRILPSIPKSLRQRGPLQPRNDANFLGLRTITDAAVKAANPLSKLWNNTANAQVDDVAARLRDCASVVITNSNLGLAMNFLSEEEDSLGQPAEKDDDDDDDHVKEEDSDLTHQPVIMVPSSSVSSSASPASSAASVEQASSSSSSSSSEGASSSAEGASSSA
ncbi:hypothetical protein CTAYLR_006055 [Chrysophaeum taylorii]|uniref:PX domain-containing protein n=1 Tax=Chrysophaeum taylorii TaxID=2483200 RepID=A0AAD7UL33_9STRA|nr:hypothetical protein CTAYLR_006055 [Chrysophaeum taylorii]